MFILIELIAKIIYYYKFGFKHGEPMFFEDRLNILGVNKQIAYKILSLASKKEINKVKQAFPPDISNKIQFDYTPLLGFHPSPNQNLNNIQTNNEGFRTPSRTYKKPRNVKRVLILGGSAAFGVHATSNENTISYQLEKKLNKDSKDSDRRWEVINLSSPGFISFQELIIMTKTGLLYDPDYVISFSGFNDIIHYILTKNINQHGLLHMVKSSYDFFTVPSKHKNFLMTVLAREFVIFDYLKLILNKSKKEIVEDEISPYMYTLW